MTTIRTFEAFAGYGSQLMALKRLQARYPDSLQIIPVGIAEIDKYALQAYNAVHGEVTNYGDISQIDWAQVPDFDLFTYSSPCQDFSQAGKQQGGEKGSGTRSSLLWECERAIREKRPKYLLMENVSALVSQKFIRLFNSWQAVLEGYGYSNFAQVLNAKDYGVPQNRERIFMISILDENAAYEFPKPIPLTCLLKDLLEQQVDEKYYLSSKLIEYLDKSKKRHREKGNGFGWKPTDGNVIANTLLGAAAIRPSNNFIIVLGYAKDIPSTHRYAKEVLDPNGISKCVTSAAGMGGNMEIKIVELQPINTDNDGNARTITTHYNDMNEDSISGNSEHGYKRTAVLDNYRIRKLTPRECFRLMNVSDEDIDKI